MKFALLTLAALFAAGTAHAALDNAAAEAMMKKDGCAACHSVDKKIVGPSYTEVAAKYKGDKDAVAKLSKKVKEGGSGVWVRSSRPTPRCRTRTSRTLSPDSCAQEVAPLG
jgi:cytochrome c